MISLLIKPFRFIASRHILVSTDDSHDMLPIPGYGTSFGVRFGTDNNKEECIMDFLKKLSPHVHWGLRLSLAATFLFHGASKFPVEGPMMGMPVAMILLLALAYPSGVLRPESCFRRVLPIGMRFAIRHA